MRKKCKLFFNLILIGCLVGALLRSGDLEPLTAEATTIGEIQGQITQHENNLNSLNNQISQLEDEQDLLQEEIDDLNAEIFNTLTSIGMKEDEIAAKKDEIDQKQAQIEFTEEEYEAARAQEELQLQNIVMFTRLIYERGDTSYLTALLEGKGFSDILNQIDSVEKVYEYSKQKLEEYMDTKDQVLALWNRLEEEKADLEADRQQLEIDKAELQSQQNDLNSMIAKKKRESANYEAELDKIRQQAAVEKTLLQQDKQRLKKLEDQQKAAQAAANAKYTPTSYSDTINNASGSELGKQIARFAVQYVGNPYVLGGTSLTNGADCSGFTYRVYSNFGYTLPRTSTEQRKAGVGVSYENAQPGDLICYEGHVALYIGGGLIVHASNSKPYPSGGIKVSNAQYKTILAVRRIIK